LVFTTGSAQDPPDKPGLARLTAEMISGGGTKDLTHDQVVNALFPMAASVGSQVDHEMTTFSGATHIDNLDAYYKLFRALLLEPGWREEDFNRLKDSTINSLHVGLRGNNDEELGKEVLLSELYAGTPYGHYSVGTVSALQKMTLDDLKQFYKQHYTQSRLIVGIAGGYSPEFLERVKKDFSALPAKDSAPALAIHPAAIQHTKATIVEKNTRSVAYSFGFPIDVKRGDPDYPAFAAFAASITATTLTSNTFRTGSRSRNLHRTWRAAARPSRSGFARPSLRKRPSHYGWPSTNSISW
jgi:zinc protease